MNNFERTSVVESETTSLMKERTLAYLGQRLAAATYPGYPLERLRVSQEQLDGMMDDSGLLHLPEGPWSTEVKLELPTYDEIEEFAKEGIRFDSNYRPLHPWINEMLVRPELGVVTGSGFYWKWGKKNRAADPIAIAEDTGAILLIKRADTHQWALPGGFIDPGENPQEAAQRELWEETDVETREMADNVIIPSYKGAVADIRTTANAWVETNSFVIKLPYEMPTKIKQPEEVEAIEWVPRAEINERLKFGSHSLLVELALRSLPD